MTPYGLARNTTIPVELNVTLASVLRNLRSITLFSLGDTIAASFCFVFILAGYGIVSKDGTPLGGSYPGSVCLSPWWRSPAANGNFNLLYRRALLSGRIFCRGNFGSARMEVT